MVKNKFSPPKWFFPALIVLVPLAFWLSSSILSGDIEFNTNTRENHVYIESTYSENIDVSGSITETYCYNGECYTTTEEYNQAITNEQNNQDYKTASNLWKQHTDIIKNDAEKASEIHNTYCSGQVSMEYIIICADLGYPRLEAYAIHILNAQNFMRDEGDLFSNQQELFGYLDEHAITVTSMINNINSLVNQYNTWAQQQQDEQALSQTREQAVYDTLRIISGF